MTKGRTLSVVFILFVMFSGTAYASGAAQVDIMRLSENSSFALFQNTDNSGCIITSVFVVAGNVTSSVPGSSTTGPIISVLISKVDTCRNFAPVLAQGETSEEVYNIDSLLSSATVSATVPMDDESSGTSFSATVNLTWTGTGDLSNGAMTNHLSEPGFVMDTLQVGKFRPAQATGTVTNDSEINGIPAETNFTPDPSVNGQNESVQNGLVTVQVSTP